MLENHHCATAFKFLMQNDTSFFDKMERRDFILFRKYVITGILNTDMAEHFSMVNSISFKVDKEKEFTPDEEKSPEHFLDFFSLIIHTNDLFTPAKKPNISMVWANRINREFMDQLNHEKKIDLPPTPFLVGLDNLEIRAKSEGFFYDKIVEPLWGLMDRVLEGGLHEQMKQVKDNREVWRKVQSGKFTINDLRKIENPAGEQDERKNGMPKIVNKRNRKLMMMNKNGTRSVILTGKR